MKRIATTLIGVLVAAAASAVTFKGVILDENGKALPMSTVYIQGKYVGVQSDANGEFALSVDKALASDTICMAYPGYETQKIAISAMPSGENARVMLKPSASSLEVAADMPAAKAKKITKGMKSGKGWGKCVLEGKTSGENVGYEFHAKKGKRLALDKVGFYYCEGDSQMTNMKFRINIYDMSEVSGSTTDKFKAVAKPVYFDFTLGGVKKGKFEFALPERYVLPKDAMVEIEMLDDLGGKKLWYKSNMVGKNNWDKDSSGVWMKSPFAMPFFVECVEIPEKA